MSGTETKIALHDKWRQALEGEDFTPSNTWQNARPKMDDRRMNLLRYRRALYESLRQRMYRSGGVLGMVSHDDLVEEAQLLVELFKTHDDLTGASRTFGRIYDIKQKYGFPRLSKALLAVWERMTAAESRLRALGDNRSPENTTGNTTIYGHPKLDESKEDLKAEIYELIEAHKAEVAALVQENTNDKHNFSLYSSTLSRLLHDMAVHIRTAQKEKIALKAVHVAEIHALHNHIANQRTFIDSMLLFIKQITVSRSLNNQARSQQGITRLETLPHLQDKYVVIRDLKQEMERKEQNWEAERKKYEEKIAEMKELVERLQTWEGENGAQWDAVGKKKLKGKGREF